MINNNLIEKRTKSNFHITVHQLYSLFSEAPILYFVNKNDHPIIYDNFDQIKDCNVLYLDPFNYFEESEVVLDTELEDFRNV